MVGRALGHNPHTVNAGTTDDYIGDLSIDYYSARANAKPTHLREPQFALPGVNVAAAIREPVTKLEDTAWRLRNASDT